MRAHSPAICPCPYHSCLCTHQITIHTTQLQTEHMRAHVGRVWEQRWRQEARPTGRRFVNWVNCQGVWEQPALYTQEKVKTKEQMKRRKILRKRKLQSLWLQARKGVLPLSPNQHVACGLWVWRKCPLPAHCWEEMTAIENPVDGKRSESGALKSKTRDPFVLWSCLYLSVWDTILCPGDGAMKEPTWLNPSEAHGVCVGGVGRLGREELSTNQHGSEIPQTDW